MEDVEELLDSERKRREALEKRFDCDMLQMVREEMEKVLGKRPRKGEAERILEWNKRKIEMRKEMKRVLEVWAEGKGNEDRIELNSELREVLRKRYVWVKKEIEVWTVELEVRERVERERKRVERERESGEGEGEWDWRPDQEGIRGDFGEPGDWDAEVGERGGEEGAGGAERENGRSDGAGRTRKAGYG